MGVRRRDHHVIHRDPALPTRQRLRFVNQRLRHHAGIHDGKGDLRLSVIEHEASDVQAVDELVAFPFEKAPSNNARKIRRRNIRHCHSRAQGVSRDKATRESPQNQTNPERCEKSFHSEALVRIYFAAVAGG